MSERVGRGMPLRMALETEANPKINEDTWKKALKAHPNFSPHYQAARGKFLDASMRRLEEADDLKHLVWLLERRHSDLFGKREPETQVNVTNQVAIPADVLARAKEIANEKQR